jgi:hypothetical protein
LLRLGKPTAGKRLRRVYSTWRILGLVAEPEPSRAANGRLPARLSRRGFLAGAAGGALGAAGVYELVDRFATPPARAATSSLPAEQHVLDGVRTIVDNKVEVLVPPLHHEVVTFQLQTGTDRRELEEAQALLTESLAALDAEYAPTPAGLGVTVGWGLPYFRTYVPGPAARYLPVDRRASKAKRRMVRVLLDAVRFPSDPQDTILESNDAVVLLRSDHLDAIEDAAGALTRLGIWRSTSIRRGFAGGGFDGRVSLPKQMALAAGIPGADRISDNAELFLGFTSSQKAGLGPRRIANIETLGYSDGGLRGYFRRGTTMHLSHLFEDLEAWYRLPFQQRGDMAFQPGLAETSDPEDVLTFPPNPSVGPSDVADNVTDCRVRGRIGHAASLQPATRLQRDVRGSNGTLYKRGTPVPQRADFNTLDNPFFWSAEPERDRMSSSPAAGLHFVVFHPTSDDFHRARLAMDGVFPNGTRLRFPPRAPAQGINSVLHTTHRQNFLVPPRRHRSFPLAELVR